MAFFGNRRKDFSIRIPRQQVDNTPFFVIDSANIDFTLENLNLTANLTTTGVLAGTYGDDTHIPILQIDQWGRVTGVTRTTFSTSGILLQTNDVDNISQVILNLKSGTDITVTDNGDGSVSFNYIGTSGTGNVTGTGTANRLTKWTATSGNIADSSISDDGAGNVTISAAIDLFLYLKAPSVGSVTALAYQKNNITVFLAGVDSSNDYAIVSYNPSTGASVGRAIVVTSNTLNVTLASLAGTGSRMVTADANGLLGTAAIPSGMTSLTTTGSAGASTYNPLTGALNVPNYNTSATSSAFYGDGFDGIVNLDGTNTYTAFISKVGSAYTLIRNIFPSSFTIAVGVTLNTNGYQITCNGTSTINGSMGSSGNNGGNAVNIFNGYSTAGAGAVSLKSATTFTDQLLVPFTLAGGNGNNGSVGWGNPGVSIACTWYFYGSLGGGGGAGRNGLGVLQPGSTVTITTGKFLPYSGFNLPLNNYIGFGSTALANSFISVPGGGGGAGAQLGGGWGGAGGGGGGCPFGVKLISNTITISATGLINSNGGNGGNGCGGSLSNWIAGCGGGGGGGGIVYLVTNELTYTPNNQIKAKGGTGGAGGGPGAGTGAIYTPNPGSNGTDGYIHIYNTFTGTSVFYTGQY